MLLSYSSSPRAPSNHLGMSGQEGTSCLFSTSNLCCCDLILDESNIRKKVVFVLFFSSLFGVQSTMVGRHGAGLHPVEW